jgi:hypothetical protein
MFKTNLYSRWYRAVIAESPLFSFWSGIKLDHRFENGQPLSGKLADPFVVNIQYLFLIGKDRISRGLQQDESPHHSVVRLAQKVQRRTRWT